MFFLDRDTRNDFATTVGIGIQNFLKNPADINKVCEDLQASWEALPAL
jgi:hypothetical protein